MERSEHTKPAGINATKAAAFVQGAAAVVVVACCLVLIGWWTESSALKSGIPGLTAMNPLTAVCFMLSALSLWLLRQERASGRARLMARLCAGAVLLASLVKLTEYFLGWDYGLDKLLFTEKLDNEPIPNRMAPNTAVAFLLLSVALMTLDASIRRVHRPAQFMVLLIGLLSLLTLSGYAFGVGAATRVSAYIPMALNTAVLFGLTSAAVLVSRPNDGLMEVITSGRLAGGMARKLLITSVAVPFVLGFLRLHGQRAGLYDTEFGVALVVVGTIAILAVVVWFTSQSLDESDRDRARAETELRKAHEDLERRVADRTAQLRSTNKELQAEISERRQLETALRGNEVQKRAILESAFDCIIAMDDEGKTIEFNPAAEKVFGYTAREALGREMAELIIPPYLREKHRSGLAHFLATGEGPVLDRRIEITGMRSDGSEFPVELAITASAPAGKPVFTATVRDITERKRAEEELRRSEERYRAFIEQSSEGIWRFELEEPMPIESPEEQQVEHILKYLRLAECNDTMARMHGLTKADDIIGARVEDFLPRSDPQSTELPLSFIRSGYRSLDLESHVLAEDGTRRYSQSNVVGIIENGFLVRVWGTQRDITERRLAEEEVRNLNEDLERRVAERTAALAAANAELEAFSYSAAHDLRGPLTSIDGFSNAVLTDYAEKLDDDGKHYLERIRAGAKRMGQLIDGLLQLSRLARSKLETEVVDLSAMARGIAEELKRTAPERQVEFAIQEGLKARADQRLIHAALGNLLGNAWKFTGKKHHAKIEFGALEDGNRTAYFVRDDGAGFDPAYSNKLFATFQRLHLASEYEGTGIGLATVQRIVQRHGGKVWAEGEEDKGATFYFDLAA